MSPFVGHTERGTQAGRVLQRREIGIINVGETATVVADGTEYVLEKKEALYIGKGTKEVLFHPSKKGKALYYYNSAPAHAAHGGISSLRSKYPSAPKHSTMPIPNSEPVDT